MINGISGIYSIESRIKEIESNLDSVIPDSGNKSSFTEILKSKNDEAVSALGNGEIDSYIREAAAKYGVDEKLVSLVADAESGKSQKCISNKGAIGVMQLMPDTARGMGVNPYDARQNVDGGVRFLKDMLNMYNGNVEKALAAYNAGPGNVNKYNGVPPFNETRNYVNKILKKYNQE